jgi:crotonobetaine/carnitine-CoA ligase
VGGGLGNVRADDDDPAAVALDPAYVLPRRVAWWAEHEPDRPFLADVDGRALTYGETWVAVRQWMTRLHGLGLTPGDRLVTMLPSSIDAVLVWLAAGCMHVLEVPVNPELRGTFLTHVLTDSGARRALVRPELAGLLDGSGIEPRVVQRGADLAGVPAADVVALPDPQDAACVIYTSGTTGPAKGVVISWAQFAAVIGRTPRSWLSGDDAVFGYNPMFHVTGRTPLLAMTDVGGRVVLKEKFSASSLLDDARRHGCTSMTVNAALVLATPERADDADNPVRTAYAGHNATIARRFAERFGVHVLDAYGSTEVGFPIVARSLPDDGRPGFPGYLRPGYEARVVDTDGNDVGPGRPGELQIKPPARPMVMLSYLNRPDATAAAFDGDWYRTGDAVVRDDDGGFRFVDRIRDTIRRMGENISSSQVEAVVAADADVAACAVVGVPDRVAGQEVLLAVVPAAPTTFDPAALYARLTDQLARYMLPAYVVVCEDLPRTPTLKVQKTGLLETLDLAAAWRPPQRTRRNPEEKP